MATTIPIAEFTKLTTSLSGLAKYGFNFDVVVDFDYDSELGENCVKLSPSHVTYEDKTNVTFALAKLWEYYAEPVDHSLVDKADALTAKACVTHLQRLSGTEKMAFSSLKFLPTLPAGLYANDLPETYLISKAPHEDVSDGITYRYVGSDSQCLVCVDHDHPYYNYLDKGGYICLVKKKKKTKYVLAAEHSIDTSLITVMCTLDPSLLKLLVKECYIPTNQSALLKIKMEKALHEDHRATYALFKKGFLEQYAAYGNQLLLSKLNRGEIQEATVENVKLTKEGLAYEALSMTCPDFLSIALEQTNFNGDVDVYVIAHGVMDKLVYKFEQDALDGKMPAPVALTVNGFPVTLSMNANRKRFINNINIRADELFAVLKRALCFKTQATYEEFVKAVDRMSLQYHDVLANGIPIKVEELDWREVTNPEIEKRMPRLRFKKVKNKFHLLLSDKGDSIPISLRTIISRCHTLNTKCNHRTDKATRAKRDHHWVRMQLCRALIEATRLPVKDADGKITGYTGLTGEQAGDASNLVRKWHADADKRSEALLANVAKLTGATLTEFKGEPAYTVKGQLHSYYVMVKDGKIFNAETGKYICIVNFGQAAQGVGMDQIATRLMALKNDKYTAEKIGTLVNG